jgi:protein-disulfide isomerase
MSFANFLPAPRRIALALTALGLLASLGLPIAMAADAPPTPNADAELIRRLEASGVFDQAVDRAIERRIRRDAEQRQKAAAEQQAKRAALAGNARAPDPKRDHIFGAAKAPYSVIVYSDLECPYCKRFAGVAEKAAATLGDKVNVVWRHYPLDFHGKVAVQEAVAAECVSRQAGDKGFFKFVDAVLAATQTNGKGLPGGDTALTALAKDAGAGDEKKLKTCIEDASVAARVQDDMQDGIKAGIEGTPGLILRDNLSGRAQMVGGALPQEQMNQALRAFVEVKQGS